MAETTVNLGMLPQNRGEYSSSATYYKDNIVQYNGSSYICTATMDLEHPSGITGVAPYDSDPATPNTGWAVFSNDSSGIGEGVYNVSVDHTTDNQPKVYANLSAALSDIPAAKQKGGMSIKFIQGTVQSFDHKYIRYNLIADEFTTDVTKWAIADEGVYVENLEFVYVKTDAENKILWAIKTDGDIYYGAGCPQQVKDYIEEKIADLSLDEYEDIVTFLSDYLGSDTTLKAMIGGINAQIATKVDKAEGKSLIDSEYASTKSTIDNPEFLEVITDSEDKVLEGIQQDGTKVIGADLKVGGDTKILGNMEVSGVSYNVIENPEYLAAWVDTEDKVIFGLKTDGKTYVGDADFLDDIEDIKAFLANITDKNIDWDALSSITATEAPEYISVVTDSEDKILAGRTPDGAAFEKVGFSTPKVSIDSNIIENIEDPEGRIEIKTDVEGKIIFYRKDDGTLVENVGIKTNSIQLTTQGMTEFQQALRDSGFTVKTPVDWSDAESLDIPMPRCAIVNITNDTNNAVWPTTKTADYQYYLQFWDMQGNYFKKPVIYNAQGNSSLGMPKKNGGLDIFADTWDGEAFTLKIGNWVPQDSFHLKAYYADYFVGVCAIAYKLFDQITATRDIFTNRDWKKALIPDKATIGTGCRAMDGENDKYSLDNDARCFPDGFPCIVYLNGDFYGVYSWQLKKHCDNYMMSKKKPKHIHLDGCLSNESIFLANGNLNWDIISGVTADSAGNKDGIEIRNPKPKKKKDGWNLTCIDGSKYDGDDNRQEIMGSENTGYDSTNESHVKSNQTKQALVTLSTYVPELQQMETDNRTATEIRTRMAEMFDVESFIDYLVFGDAITNWDGFRKNWQWITYDGIKWFVEPYDMDGVFGWSGWNEVSPTHDRYGNDKRYPSGWIIQYYSSELNARYAELRDKGILTTANILSIFKDWIAAIGTDNYQKNHDKWPNDNEHYSGAPVDTHYDNIYRVSNWLDARIAKCDEIYSYSVPLPVVRYSGTLVSGNVPEFDGTDGVVKDSGIASTDINPNNN